MTTEGNVTHRGNGQGNPFLTKGVSSPRSLEGNSPGKEGKPFPSLAGLGADATTSRGDPDACGRYFADFRLACEAAYRQLTGDGPPTS